MSLAIKYVLFKAATVILSIKLSTNIQHLEFFVLCRMNVVSFFFFRFGY